MKKLVKVLSFVLIVSLLVIGCGKTTVDEAGTTAAPETTTQVAKSEANQTTTETNAPQEPTVSRVVKGLFTAPTGVFNPILADSDYDETVNDIVFSSLLQLDDNLDLIPDLAEKYEVSEDNKTITFYLRKDLQWHDGKPFTAKDVKFTFESMAKPTYDGPLYGTVSDLVGAEAVHNGAAENIEGIKLLDDNTISFTFNDVYAPGLIRVSTEVGIIAEHIWSKAPIENWKKSTDLLIAPIGTGPYVFKTYVPGQFVELEAFADYYAGKPKLDNFVFKITNQDTAISSLTNGEIDFADISNFKKDEMDALAADGLIIHSFAGKSYQYMGFNMRLDVFKDKRVRQAFTYAIDRKTIIEQLLKGNGTLINAPMLPDTWQYPKDGLNAYDFSPQKAKELLKEVGYEDRDNDGVLENADGEKLALTLTYPSGNKIREQYAVVIKKYLGDIGVEIELKMMEFSALLEEVMKNHEFDLFLLGSSLSLDPDPIPYWSTSAASDEKGVGAWNIPGYRNAEADKYMEMGLNVLSTEERAKVYKEFAKIFNDDPPIVLLYAPNIVKAASPKLKNYQPATFTDYYDIANWMME